MNRSAKETALGGMMVALAVVIMLLGGVIPLATFCCPAIAGLLLIPVMESGEPKWAFGAYIAIALLTILLGPDKEAAMVFACLGYYPAIRPKLAKIRRRPIRIAVKLLIFNVGAALALLLTVYVFGLTAVMAEYREMGKWMLILFVVLVNVTVLVYDRLLEIMTVVYRVRFLKQHR